MDKEEQKIINKALEKSAKNGWNEKKTAKYIKKKLHDNDVVLSSENIGSEDEIINDAIEHIAHKIKKRVKNKKNHEKTNDEKQKKAKTKKEPSNNVEISENNEINELPKPIEELENNIIDGGETLVIISEAIIEETKPELSQDVIEKTEDVKEEPPEVNLPKVEIAPEQIIKPEIIGKNDTPKEVTSAGVSENEIKNFYNNISVIKPFELLSPLMKLCTNPSLNVSKITLEDQVKFWNSYIDIVALYPKYINKYWLEELGKITKSDDK